MPKDTFWFKHDYEPTSDPKIQALLADYGGLGYGIYWRIVEMLHSDNNHKLPLKNYIFTAIAKQMEANAKQNKANVKQESLLPEQIKILINECIFEYELFVSDGEFFWSERINRNIEDKRMLSIIRSKSGQKGGSKKSTKANAKQIEANAKQTQANFIGEERRGEDKNKQKNKADGVPPPPPQSAVFVVPDKFYTASDLNGLPAERVDELKRFFKVVHKQEISQDEIIELWDIFKNQNLTGTKPYLDKNDVYRHFFNTTKKQRFKSERKTRIKTQSHEKVTGIEYLNDFAQCKMSDGSVQELDENQRSMAKFQGIKPNAIVKK